MKEYTDFLHEKVTLAKEAGFEPPSPPHESLKPHQRDLSAWAIRKGRAGVMAQFGLGKSRVQLQLMKWVHEHTGGKTLIVAPLGVRQEFTKSDGPAMGMQLAYCRTSAEVEAAETPYIITNYERLIERYSNPDEVIFDPFAGVGSVPYSALKMDRIGWGTELNPDYWQYAVGYCESAEAKRNMPSLFDFVTEDEPSLRAMEAV